MHAYLLALEIAPMEVGETYTMLPLHCTLVHWFWLELGPADFGKQLERMVKHAEPLALHSGKEAVYTGTTKQGPIPVTVNTITPTRELIRLHSQICSFLDELNVKYTTPQYIREGYSPHVTQQGSEKLPTEAVHQSSALYIVEADAPEYGNDRYIHSKIKLSS